MSETRKWVLHRISAVILAPLYAWLYFSFVSLSTKNYSEAASFFKNPLFEFFTIMLFFFGFLEVSCENVYIFISPIERSLRDTSIPHSFRGMGRKLFAPAAPSKIPKLINQQNMPQ